ncbi:MAG: hypothetical protein LBK94_00005, partial [Prevotellaceae bacterium]|nr:hypothetical protein [Prevotellaceae bacterium]
GCKCDWIETFDDAADKAPAGPPPAQGLEGNPAQTGEIFTDRASYFKSVNKKTGKQINNIYAIFSRKTAVEDGKTLYGKKTKVNTDSGEIDVEYNRDGIEHIAYDRLSGNRNYIKNQIIKYLDKYLENAEFIKSAENHKLDKKPNVERYYYYKIILPDGKPAYLNVQKKKGKYTLYAMTETLKEN